MPPAWRPFSCRWCRCSRSGPRRPARCCATTISLATELKNNPKAAADSIPLWQMLPGGEVVFDVKNGRLHKAQLTITKEVKNHQGENSSCTFNSTLSIEYAGDR